MRKLLHGVPVLILIFGVAIDWSSVMLGWWWLTLPVGIVMGWLLRGFWRTFLLSLLAGALGWGLPLLVLFFSGAPLLRSAVALEAIMGFQGVHGVVIISITLLTGILLSVAGAWLGSASRGIFSLLLPRLFIRAENGG